MKLFKLGTILFATIFFIVSCTDTKVSQSNNKNAANVNTNSPKADSTPDELASGRKNYKIQCSKCHGDDGTGGEIEIEGKKIKPDDLTTAKMIKEPDEEYIKYMTNGIEDEGMPSFKEFLSKEKMQEIVKFIRKELQKQ
jgi:mono/diheme cytochrome c family protein